MKSVHIGAGSVPPVTRSWYWPAMVTSRMLSDCSKPIQAAVVHLASEDCTDSGSIILAAGGRYSRIQYFQSPGHEFDHLPSVDELAANWDKITDMSEAKPRR